MCLCARRLEMRQDLQGTVRKHEGADRLTVGIHVEALHGGPVCEIKPTNMKEYKWSSQLQN